MAMNCWIFSGHCARDGETRRLQDGTAVLNFTVAGKDGFGDREVTNWVDCALFGKRAETLGQYLKKGTKVTVKGSLRLETFQKRDGAEGSKLSVRVEDIDLGSKSEGGEQRQSGGYGSRASADDVNRPLGNERGGTAGRGGGKPAFDQNLDDEIPFSYLEGMDPEGCACAFDVRAKSLPFTM